MYLVHVNLIIKVISSKVTEPYHPLGEKGQSELFVIHPLMRIYLQNPTICANSRLSMPPPMSAPSGTHRLKHHYFRIYSRSTPELTA